MSITQRYGDPQAAPSAMAVWNDVLDTQVARRSVRRFLDTPVTEAQLEALVVAAQSAPTSSNLQPWSVVAVQDPGRKAELAALAGDQAFITQAPLFLVWIADLGRARRLAAREGRPLAAADFLETTLIGFLDAGLAAQNAVVAASSLGLGSVFVGAVRNRPEEVGAVLGLPEHAVAVVGLAVGLPDPDEAADVKPRLPLSAVLHRERYDVAAADDQIGVYDERLAAYNQRFGLAGGWSERVLNRLSGPRTMAGRHRLRSQLESLGFPSR